MKIKPVFVGIVIVGVLLLLLSLSTVAKVLSATPRQVLTGVQNQPLAVNILPKRSPLWISFLVKPEKLGLFAQLAAPPSDRAEVRRDLATLKQQLRQNWLLDYEQDIQPWLDQEIALAVTDLDLDAKPENGLQTGYLLAFTIKDAELAKSSIDAFWQRLAVDGADLNFEQYQGVPIISNSFVANQPAIAGTVLDKFVLFANDPRVLHQAIATLQSPETSVASLDNYRDRLTSLDIGRNKGKVIVAYVNLAEFGADLPQESLLINFSFDKSGIRAKTALTLANSDQNSPSSQASSSIKNLKNSFSNIANLIPSASSVLIGHNLDQTIQNLQATLLPEWRQAIAQVLSPLDIANNALAWVEDDYAIAFLPKTNNAPDWLIVTRAVDAQKVETAISDLDRSVRSKFTVGEISLKAQPVTVWTKLSASNNSGVSGNVVAAHSQTKDYLYLSNSLAVLESALNLKNNQAIATSTSFKNAIAKLPKNGQNYAYLDKNLDISLLQNSFFNLNNTSEIFGSISNLPLALIHKHIKAIALNDIDNSQNIQSYEALLILK